MPHQDAGICWPAFYYAPHTPIQSVRASVDNAAWNVVRPSKHHTGPLFEIGHYIMHLHQPWLMSFLLQYYSTVVAEKFGSDISYSHHTNLNVDRRLIAQPGNLTAQIYDLTTQTLKINKNKTKTFLTVSIDLGEDTIHFVFVMEDKAIEVFGDNQRLFNNRDVKDVICQVANAIRKIVFGIKAVDDEEPVRRSVLRNCALC